MTTPWGYEILNETSIPPILTVEEFNEMTADKYANDQRVQETLNAITASLRNYCGWHLAGNIACSVTYTFDDLHVTKHNRDLLIQLPTRCATSLINVSYNEFTLDIPNFLKQNGLLRIYNFATWVERYDRLKIDFMSGLTDDSIKSIIANRAGNVLSGNTGVNSETAGGVSITYNTSYVAGLNPTTLLTADREFLLPYKIEEML